MSYLDERRKYIEAGRPLKTKEKKPIAKKSAKRIEKEAKEREERGDDDTELVKWYKNRMKYMSVCEETGLKVETKIYAYAIMSICHILGKRDNQCPSVKTHPCNFVILLPDLHTKFDAMSWEEREQMSCWPVIKERLIMIYPDLAPSERRHFPQSVLDYMETINPFC